MLRNTVRLIQGAKILQVPIVTTEQYPKGLGRTVTQIAEAVGGQTPLEKLAFSACGALGFVSHLRERGLSDILLCGIEAHVCVLQTGLDLIAEDFRVFVVADAVASRAVENQQLALERLRAAGAVIVSTEMALFELLEQAGTAEFRQILELIK